MLADEFVCGAHSNIPLCCQIFYANPWKTLRKKNILPKGRQTSNGSYINDEGEVVYRFGFKGDWFHGDNYYVLCPECIVRVMEGRFKPQTVKDCDCAT